MVRAERNMAVVKLAIRENPVLAFVHNITAYQSFPYQVEIRRQLPGALLALMTTQRAVIEPEAAEIVWEVSKSVSPYDTAGLVSRAAYLLNYGKANELPIVAERMKQVAPWQIETWIVEGYVALMLKDKARLETALERAKSLHRQDAPAVAALTEQLRSLE